MVRQRKPSPRSGTVLPLLAVSVIGLCGFVALAVDVGMITVAKTQCQNAADAAAMYGARSLDGSSSQNLGAVGTTGSATDNAMQMALANPVLNTTLPQSAVTLQFGAWHYDPTSQTFAPQYPPQPPDNYTLAQVTVSYTGPTAFAQVLGIGGFTVTAQATAAHRPRDVLLILDYSGSMNNESDLWNCESYLDNGLTNTTSGYTWPQTNNPNWTSNNTETVYPLFGHYSNQKNYSDYVHYANLLSPTADASSPLSGNTLIGKSNVSQAVLGVPALVGDFYQSSRGAPLQAAFSSAPDSYANGTDPNQGDNYLPKRGQAVPNYATNVYDVNGGNTANSQFESSGYAYYTGKTFQGYTVGPRYWGKTFFIWPPDPTSDWRKKFFFKSDGVTPCNDNTLLFQNQYPGYNDPPGNYVINYKAILNWIQNTGPNPFPSQLRAGYVLYYGSIPTDVPSSAYDHTQPNANITNPDQRFWKEYIDWTLGVWRDPTGTIQHTQTSTCSIGPDYQFGTPALNTPPGDGRYMNYGDNPWRPRHRLWFGPMTMVQFMSDTGLLPGTAHDISMYSMKSGVAAALADVQNNHPNDLVALLPFSRPQYNNDPVGCGTLNFPAYSLCKNYQGLINSLWLPPGSSTADVRPWDGNGTQVPRAHGDYDSNTASSYGFMLAYNQFSGSTSLSSTTPASGGFGRKGASKVIVYETDGMANEDSVPASGFMNQGAYSSYYTIRPGDTVNGAGYSQANLLQIVEAICNKTDGTSYAALPTGAPSPPAYPGYATTNKPVIVHCLAFGAIFETSSSTQTSAVSLLQMISSIGSTTFPSSSTDPANGYKWCIGTLSQRQQKLEQAFQLILDSSVPVSLVQ